MRLFIISLLALSAHAHSVAYRTNLLSYAPSRGEFAVDHGQAQGYVRYFDGSGAERLLPYYYPEPLYGLRRLSYGGGDVVHPLLRTSLKSESSQDENALFRAWCEQRYNALKSEIDRLRAAGKTPSAHMISQFEPLEKLIKAGAYDSGIASGLSPDVLAAREEHYRIWNEARLKVLQAEEQQMRLYGMQYTENKPQEDILLKPFDLQSRIDLGQAKPAQQQLLSQAQYQQSSLKAGQVQLKEYSAQAEYTPGQAPQPVQDTPEVQRAREEHLKLLKQAQQNALIGQTEQYQKPAQSQPAIKYTQIALPAIVEKQATIGSESQAQTKQYESQSESKYTPGQLPQPVQETPEVQRAREEHLRLIEQAKKNLQSASQYNSYSESGAYKQLAEGQADIKSSIQPIAALKTNYESASLQQQDQQQQQYQQQQQALQETPEVLRAREEHLRLVDEAKIRIEDRFADEADLIKLEERERDKERLRELEQRKEEENELELERQREAERQKEEQRLMAAELIAQQAEEQQRMEKERYEDAERLKKEEIEQLKYKTTEYQTKYIAQPHLLLQQQQQPIQQTQQQTQQLQQNGFFLRIQGNQPNALLQQVPSGGAYIIAGQQTAGTQYYIPSTHENPFLLRYTQDAQPNKPQLTALSLVGDYKKSAIDKQISQAQPQQLKSEGNLASSSYSSGASASTSSSSSSSSSLSSSSATSSFASSSDAAVASAAGISELDKATRDHFRAHEIALEQLRLANLKTPCN